MKPRLKTSLSHRLVTSPLGAVMNTSFYERLKIQSLRWEFAVARCGAAARAASEGYVDDFLRELPLVSAIAPQLRRRLSNALQRYSVLDQEYADVHQRWEAAFWGGAAAKRGALDARLAVERERRRRAVQWVRPTQLFGYLGRNPLVPAVKFAIPSPPAALAEYAAPLADPQLIYGAPSTFPEIETSAPMPGPAGSEYWIRFPTPTPLRDTVYARVYEPPGQPRAISTLIYGSGLGMVYDRFNYWPEEEYLGRALAGQGYRVVLLESPWHGRRTPREHYSGERFLAQAPLSLIQLYGAQTQEIAVLVQWARALGAPIVAAGGISLSGIVAQQVANWCGTWPAFMRPDMTILISPCGRATEALIQSEVGMELGVDTAVRRSGWDDEKLRQLHPLLDPNPSPGLNPHRIFAVLGEQDKTTPYRFAMEMLDEWNVPPANRLVWQAGHFGVLVRLIRQKKVQQLIVNAVHQRTYRQLQKSAIFAESGRSVV